MHVQMRSDRRRSMRERLAALTGTAPVTAPKGIDTQTLLDNANAMIGDLEAELGNYRVAYADAVAERDRFQSALESIAAVDPGKGSRTCQRIAKAALGTPPEAE